MKKVTTLIILSLFFVLQGWTQKSYEMEVLNLVQLNETEFTFDIRMKNTNPSEPFAIETIQWQLSLDDFRNGGKLDNAFLTYVSNTTDLVGVVMPNSADFSTNVANNVIQWISPILGDGQQTTFFGDGDWKKIGTFKLQLRNAANTGFLNFSDMHHGIDFITNQVLVFHCNYTESGGQYFRNGAFAEEITSKTLTNNLLDRQLAGYWFEGDGDWDDTSLWNNVTVENTNTLPGANANAIINGNVTIPNVVKSDISLLPDVDGNGGELTVLTGEEPLFSLQLIPNGTGVQVNLYDESYNILPNPSTGISVGTQFYFNTTGIPPSGSFINWTDQNSNVIGTSAFFGPYNMPASDMVITANWTSGSKSVESVGGNSPKSLYASLTIVPGASLTVDKLFNDNENGAEAILIKSDATGTGYLIHNNEGVQATVERFLTGTKYHYVSSPIEDGTQSIFYGVLGVDDFYEWVETIREWINLNHPDNYNPTGILAPGKGYAVAYASGDLTKEFAGSLNVGNVGILSTYTPGTSAPYWNQRGFNLLGNPYPAALVADDFLDANADVYGLYFWDEAPNYQGSRNDYAVYTYAGGTGTAPGVNGANPTAPTGFIAPMQGFMTQLKHEPFNVDYSTTINFDNDMRSIDETYFYKEVEERDRIWLSVTGPEDDYNEILVAFMEGAQEELDRTDAEKIKGNEMLSFFSMLDGVRFAIQGLPVLNPTDTYEIPLGLTVGISGQYTFNAEFIENFDTNTDITFEDRITGDIINLWTTPQYVVSFDVPDEPIDIYDRFFLHINGPTSVPVINQYATKVYAINNQIYLMHTGASEILDVDVINTLGQVVVRKAVNATEATITVPGRNIVYIVKVRTSEGVESHKLLIR